MKNTRIRRKSKSDIRKLQDRLWKECRRITIERYGNTCYTCGQQNLEKQNCQVGHFIPKAACPAELKYDLNNLRPQCFRCNINLGGNQSEYYRRLEKEHGKEYVDKLFEMKHSLVKADKAWYENKINKYEQI